MAVSQKAAILDIQNKQLKRHLSKDEKTKFKNAPMPSKQQIDNKKYQMEKELQKPTEEEVVKQLDQVNQVLLRRSPRNHDSSDNKGSMDISLLLEARKNPDRVRGSTPEEKDKKRKKIIDARKTTFSRKIDASIP